MRKILSLFAVTVFVNAHWLEDIPQTITQSNGQTIQCFASGDQYAHRLHDKDDYTLTSKQYIWAYPGKSYTDHTVMVMPEWKEDVDWDTLRATNCFGICTDYPQRLI